MTTKELLTETFTGKDGYLAWRKAWRAAYKQLSEDIRLMNLCSKDHCRNTVTDWDVKLQRWNYARPWTPAEQARRDALPAAQERSRQAYRDHGMSLSNLSTFLLARRKWSKEEAQAQYLASRSSKEECSTN